MAQPLQSGGGGPPTTTTTPAQDWVGPNGWYFISFSDGTVALAYLKDHIFQWTGGKAPQGHGEIAPYFLGTAQAIEQHPSGLEKLLNHFADAKQAQVIIHAVDSGIGKAVWVTPGAKSSGGFKPGSSAAPVKNPFDVVGSAVGNAASTIASAISSPFAFLGSASFWAGLGMSLAGAGLVAFGVFQLSGVNKSTAIRFIK